MQKLYAHVLYTEAQKKGADARALVARLSKHLKETGREKLWPSILRELTKIEQQQAKLTPMVEVAHEKDSAHALKEAAAHGIQAQEAVVNKTLVTGWRATQGGKLVDRSGKSALVALYQRIITAH